ncbi:MAG: hypothetical protein HZA15_12840, partial [Nitrospirae bacterium]|nr:hypothetical protein [Nitrospirota bacterium]
EAWGEATITVPEIRYDFNSEDLFSLSEVPVDRQATLKSSQFVFFGKDTGKPQTGICLKNVVTKQIDCYGSDYFIKTNYTAYGVDVSLTTEPKLMMRSDKGYTYVDTKLNYTILPPEYSASIVDIDLLMDGYWAGYLPGIKTQGSDSVTITAGSRFDVNATYAAEAVLNRGSAIEVRSEKVPLLNAALIPDYDRNGVIDDADRDRAFRGDTFYFWINDDDDNGETNGSDIPGEKQGLLIPLDHNNSKVDGVRDLIDFFPVYLDIRDLLKNYEPAKYAYKLLSGDECLNFVFTDLTAKTSGNYLTGGTNSLEPIPTLGGANTVKINGSGTFLNNHPDSPAFLQKIKEQAGQGIILLEGKMASNSPLEFAVFDGSKKVVSLTLNLSLSGVEQMFRHKNLVWAANGPQPEETEKDRFVAAGLQAANFPDNECTGNEDGSGKNFVFLHGYNVNGQSARGWHSEMFKRMFWSGSRAKFWGVTWYGSYSQIDLGPAFDKYTINFYRNVVNAFETASAFKYFLVNSVKGEKIVAAHSLGNMVVSSAIADHYAPVDKYFMFNAAVALEAFEETEPENPQLIPSAWNSYASRLRASEWYRLFKGQNPSDEREKLTWKNRFSAVKNMAAFNFYSEGDEVVSGSWQSQETLKGFVPIISSDGGWKFNSTDYAHGPEYDIPLPEANALTDETLRIRPFFDKGGIITPLLSSGPSGSNEASSNRNELLSRAFPATTWATGREKSKAVVPTRNVNMQSNKSMTTKTIGTNTITYWPAVRDKQWLHSDIKNVAYPYLFKVFDNIICSGGLGTCKAN